MKNTPELHNLMQALSDFLNSDHDLTGPDMPGFMDYLWRFVPLSDSCDRCRLQDQDRLENSTVWPMSVEPADDGESYVARYKCHRCSLSWWTSWDEMMVNSTDHGAMTFS